MGQKDCCCDMRGMLSFLILFLLSRRAMRGPELSDEIGKRKGARPSPGTIYPALKALKKAGFVEERREGRTNAYSLTKKGEMAFGNARRRFCSTFTGIFE